MGRTRKNKQETIIIPTKSILSCDPSMTAFGWSIIDYDGNVINAGCIKTKPVDKKLRIRKADDYVRRLNEMDMALLNIVKMYNVKYILSELPHGSQNATAAKMLGGVAALVQMLADCKQLGIEWYSEADSKYYVLGKRAALKSEMIDAIKRYFPDYQFKNVKYWDEAVADSLAIYVLAKAQSPTLKFLSNG